MVELNKRSKKEQKEYYKSQRVMNGFNTGTRSMKSNKDYNRKKNKNELKKALLNF